MAALTKPRRRAESVADVAFATDLRSQKRRAEWLHRAKVGGTVLALLVIVVLLLLSLRIDPSYVVNNASFILQGLLTTIGVSLASIFFASILALLAHWAAFQKCHCPGHLRLLHLTYSRHAAAGANFHYLQRLAADRPADWHFGLPCLGQSLDPQRNGFGHPGPFAQLWCLHDRDFPWRHPSSEPGPMAGCVCAWG